MRSPRESRLAGLELYSYDLGLETLQGKVIKSKLWKGATLAGRSPWLGVSIPSSFDRGPAFASSTG
jgi:hypothetical protein